MAREKGVNKKENNYKRIFKELLSRNKWENRKEREEKEKESNYKK
jgi:hypothetical protein